MIDLLFLLIIYNNLTLKEPLQHSLLPDMGTTVLIIKDLLEEKFIGHFQEECRGVSVEIAAEVKWRNALCISPYLGYLICEECHFAPKTVDTLDNLMFQDFQGYKGRIVQVRMITEMSGGCPVYYFSHAYQTNNPAEYVMQLIVSSFSHRTYILFVVAKANGKYYFKNDVCHYILHY